MNSPRAHSQKSGGQFQFICVLIVIGKNPLGGKLMPTPTNKRSYPRFQVPGAVLSYKEKTCQLVSLGRGGLAFSTDNHLKPGAKLSVLLTFSAKHAPIQLQGQAVYCIPNPKVSNHYTIGISFAPFSTRRGHNSPESSKVLRQLEYANIGRRANSIHRHTPSLPAANP